MSTVTTLSRAPSVEEYAELIASVGWKIRDPQAIRAALDNGLCAVVAETDVGVVGMGRVIGDRGLHYFLADVVVRPEFQRRGIGTAIVRALQEFIDRVPHKNTFVGVFAAEGTREFYSRLGYKAQRADGPAMYRWLNSSKG